MSTTSSSSSSSACDSVSSTKKVSCCFNPSTCQSQSFSIPEKIVFYIAKNAKNAETFKKLVKTCKYFYKVNPVVVVEGLNCCQIDGKWYPSDDGTLDIGFRYYQSINFKIWVTQSIESLFGGVSKMITSIFKNDATFVDLHEPRLTFGEFVFLAGNAKELQISNTIIKYENGKTVQLEDIVKYAPKLQKLDYESNDDESDVNRNTVRKLIEIEHFKNISELVLYNMPESLDVEAMFKYITENKHIGVNVCYRKEISDPFKEFVRKYSNLLKKENKRNSWAYIAFDGMRN